MTGRTNDAFYVQVGQMAGRTNGRSDKWRILCIGRTNVTVGQTSGRTNVGRTNVGRTNVGRKKVAAPLIYQKIEDSILAEINRVFQNTPFNNIFRVLRGF
jgi:hypothetical protein